MMMLVTQISRLVTRPGIAYDISFLLELSIDVNWTGKNAGNGEAHTVQSHSKR
jgi:hypothetical protein